MNEPAERQSLASGFRNVDTSGDPGACRHCLEYIADIPFFRTIKRESIRMIADSGARRVLDAGCGPGRDLAALAACLPEPCDIVGLDTSQALLAGARERVGVRNRCSLVRGDILNNPFRDGSFDACRIDRVLQHLPVPELAVRELVRILRPGGTLVAFDNDWDTFSISLGDRQTAARVSRYWRDTFASGRVGRDLPWIFRECGIVSVRVEPRKLEIYDLSVAERVFDLPHLLGRMVQTRALAPEDAAAVRDGLRQRAAEGTFSAGYTGYLVHGRKPA